MRFLAYLALLVALAAAGWAGQLLWAELQEPAPGTVERQEAAEAERAPQIAAVEPVQPWPTLFGEPEPPKPPEPPAPEPVAEPQPPKPKMPPLDSLGYVLKGVVRTDTGVWAMVSHPTQEMLLREGDTLQEGLIVARIDEAGVWISTEDGASPELLGFTE